MNEASSSGPARARARGVVLGAALVALLAGCGTEAAGGGDGGDDGGSGAPGRRVAKGDDFASPSPEPGKPSHGKGSKDPDDLNGDGYPDFLTVATQAKAGGATRTAVVWGGAKGLDPNRYTTYEWDELGISAPESPGEGVGASGLVTADLDGDGYPELIAGDQVVQGGPEGPRADGGTTKLRLPEGLSGKGLTWTRGDFNGDGKHDLAALVEDENGSDEGRLVLLYGPFGRDGGPADSEVRASSAGELQAEELDPAGERRGTALLTRVLTEGEQVPPTRYDPGPDGLSREGKELRPGNGAAFGDFDGDGKRDLVIGDTGSRNDELTEEEQSEGAGTATLYPGGGGKVRTFKLPANDPGELGNGTFATLRTGQGEKDALLVPTKSGGTAMEVPEGRRGAVRRTLHGTVDGKELWKYDRESELAGAADYDGDGRDEVVLSWVNTRIHQRFETVPSHWWFTDPWRNDDKGAFSTVPYAGK